MQRRVATQSANWGRLPSCTAHACGVVYKVDLYGNTLQRHPCPTVPHQIHLQWRCAASKVKDMPDKQFQETKDAADAAADDPGANDHFDKILDSLQTNASDKMNKAVSNAHEALAKQTVAGKWTSPCYTLSALREFSADALESWTATQLC